MMPPLALMCFSANTAPFCSALPMPANRPLSTSQKPTLMGSGVLAWIKGVP